MCQHPEGTTAKLICVLNLYALQKSTKISLSRYRSCELPGKWGFYFQQEQVHFSSPPVEVCFELPEYCRVSSLRNVHGRNLVTTSRKRWSSAPHVPNVVSQDSAVSIVTRLRAVCLRVRGSIPNRNKKYISKTSRPA